MFLPTCNFSFSFFLTLIDINCKLRLVNEFNSCTDREEAFWNLHDASCAASSAWLRARESRESRSENDVWLFALSWTNCSLKSRTCVSCAVPWNVPIGNRTLNVPRQAAPVYSASNASRTCRISARFADRLSSTAICRILARSGKFW